MPSQRYVLRTAASQRDRWTRVALRDCDAAHAPSGRSGHSVVVGPNGHMYMWGGVSGCDDHASNYLNDCHQYNPIAKVWTNFPLSGEVPCGRAFHSAIAYHTEMLIFGGCNGKGRFNEVYGVDFLSGACRKIATSGAPPATRYCHSATFHDNKMYVFGGKCGGRISKKVSDMFVLDLETNVWESIEGELPTSRSAHTALACGGKLVLMGGRDAEGRCCEDLHEFDFTHKKWTLIHTGLGPFARARHSAVVHNNSIIAFAGWNGRKKMNDLVRYSMDTQEFELLHDNEDDDVGLPSRRECHSSAVVGNKIVVFGGRFRGVFLGDVFEFDLEPPSLVDLCREWIVGHDVAVEEGRLPDALEEDLMLNRHRATEYHKKCDLRQALRKRQGNNFLALRYLAPPAPGKPLVIHPAMPKKVNSCAEVPSKGTFGTNNKTHPAAAEASSMARQALFPSPHHNANHQTPHFDATFSSLARGAGTPTTPTKINRVNARPVMYHHMQLSRTGKRRHHYYYSDTKTTSKK